jgi:hypothetical protein
MRNRNGSMLTIGAQRATADVDVNRGFCDNSLPGPEPRVVFINPYDSTNKAIQGRI